MEGRLTGFLFEGSFSTNIDRPGGGRDREENGGLVGDVPTIRGFRVRGCGKRLA